MIDQTAATSITPSIVAALRSEHGHEAAAMIMAVASEQRRAREKLGPGTWMITAQAIRQATDRVVANYKASLLGDRAVFDLCGGIGGDAIEFARRGRVATIDHDSQLAAMAAANLSLDRASEPRAAAGPGQQRTSATPASAIAICADVTKYPIPHTVAVHIDPDRRPEQRRTVRPSNYLPSLQFVERLVQGRDAALVKLAPAAALELEAGGGELARRHHRQWISLDSSVREQTLLCGDVIAAAGVVAGGRSAVRLMRDGTLQRFAVDAQTASRLDEIDGTVELAGMAPAMIIDLDPAVRGAGLSAALAAARGLRALGGPAGFFCSVKPPQDRSLMQCFETLWSGPADRKQIKRQLRRNDWNLQSIKVRGSGHDPAELQRVLRADKQQHKQSAVRLEEQQQIETRRSDQRSASTGSASTGSAGSPPPGVPVTLLLGRQRHGVYAVIGRRVW